MSSFPSLSLGLARAVRFGQCCAIVVAMACVRVGGDPLEDARHLRVGLDPRTEADAIERRLVQDGFSRVTRVDAVGAVGLAMRDDAGRSVLRVVTRRGLVLAVQAPTEALTRSEVGLVEAPADLDGDGYVELVAAATDVAVERRCLALVRVLEDGGLVEVTPDLRALGGDACLEVLSDVGADGRFEVVAVTRFPVIAWGRPPQVAVAFAPTPCQPEEPVAAPGACWRSLVGDRAVGFVARERAGRESALRAARSAGDVAAVYRLGVELAALARHSGATTDAQVGVLRGAADGLTLRAAARERWLVAADYIRRGWRTEAEVEAQTAEAGAVTDADAAEAAATEAEAAAVVTEARPVIPADGGSGER